jgi:hypothetical protein
MEEVMDEEQIVEKIEDLLNQGIETDSIDTWARCPGVLAWDLFYTDDPSEPVIQISAREV